MAEDFSEYPIDTRFCSNCKKITPNWVLRESTHERDASDDLDKCTICLWEKSGCFREYHKPWKN